MGYMVYYIVTLALNGLLLFFLRAYINITSTSLVPLFLIGLSVFQATYFYKNRSKQDFNAYNSSDLTDDEWEKLSLSMSGSYLILIPWFFPMVFFFSTLIKTLLSVLVFLIAFTGGAIFFRMCHKKSFQKRMKLESDELEEQKKRESLGKFK